MYILVGYDNERGLIKEGIFNSHKEAYQNILTSIKCRLPVIDDAAIMENYPFASCKELTLDDGSSVSFHQNVAFIYSCSCICEWTIFEI